MKWQSHFMGGESHAWAASLRYPCALPLRERGEQSKSSFTKELFKNHLNLFQHDILAEPFFRDLLGFAAGYDLGDAVI